MPRDFALALCRGAERVSAWAELLNSINVFPIADGDTGRNLALSLYPLKQIHRSRRDLQQELLLTARGNSGNISASFFTSLVTCENAESLVEAAALGRERAYRAVAKPQPGTMLSFFDGLVRALQAREPRIDMAWTTDLMTVLEGVVRETVKQQPLLQAARVIDSGALGMFLFFEAYFYCLTGAENDAPSIESRFGTLLQVDSGWHVRAEKGNCVDVVLKLNTPSANALRALSDVGEEVVTFEQDGLVKAHLHTDDEKNVRRKLEALGSLLSWSSDDMGAQAEQFQEGKEQAIHVMTDAAGSVTTEDAKRLRMTLLNSYISIGEKSAAESYIDPRTLYNEMKNGARVSTSQASKYERFQHYQGALSLYSRVLYLCVGSVYTGNYETAVEWKRERDPDKRMIVMDTGAASGKLGLIAMATARYAMQESNLEKVVAYARHAVALCREYLFLDKLQYLAAGGRLSKSSAFFGDALRMKPVITPLAEGATKVGVVRNRKQQVEFAIEETSSEIRPDRPCYIMLEYSDDSTWLETEMKVRFEKLFPEAEVFLQALSLTSGAHMGPGTWGLAFFQPPDNSHGHLRLKV
jgi:uncharacterized protein